MSACLRPLRNNEKLIVADDRERKNGMWTVKEKEWRQSTEPGAFECPTRGPSVAHFIPIEKRAGIGWSVLMTSTSPVKKNAGWTKHGPMPMRQGSRYITWVRTDPRISVSGNCFPSTQFRVYPNEDASLALAPYMARKEHRNHRAPSRWRNLAEHLPGLLPPCLPLLC